MRTWVMGGWLLSLAAIIVSIFWYNEWRYSLPTPVPQNYQPVASGEHIQTTGIEKAMKEKPLFLHFFNPACPCSRFNMPHVKSLISQYGRQVNFAIVVVANKVYTSKEIQEKYDVDIPVLFDTSLAATCGVYSTPQAVIIDEKDRLYYRGNYNKSRYCTDKKSNYAQIALEGLLQKRSVQAFNQFALTAYGCQLPGCAP
jgi:redoxin